jgi:hypothetical protein
VLSINYSWDPHATCVSETVLVYDYTASTNIVIFGVVPELQVFEIPAFFLVDPVLNSCLTSRGLFCLLSAIPWFWCNLQFVSPE